MKNKEVLKLAEGLKRLRSDLEGKHFVYAVTMNTESLMPIVKAIMKPQEASEKMKEDLQKIEDLNVEYSEKDPQGKPVVNFEQHPQTGETIGYYKIPQNDIPGSEYLSKKTLLTEEYQEDIDAHNANIKDWAENFLEEENSFVPEMITFDQLPDNVNAIEMSFLKFMVEK